MGDFMESSFIKRNTVVIDEKTPLMLLAGPMFLEMFLTTLVNNIDTLMLSHYDEYAVGAVGNANTIMFMMNILFNVIATATSVVVSQYLGAKRYDKMNMIYTLAIMVNLVVGVVLSATFCAANPLIMKFLHVSDEMRPYSMIYIYIVGGGGFIMAVYNVMLQILRCNGHPKIGMYVTLAINVINIGGNYLFLYGPLAPLNMGVAGVAISTVVSRTFGLIAVFVFFFRKKIGAGFFGGEGFIMQKLSGTGLAFVEIDGSIVEYDLLPGQTMLIDTGYLAMMEETVSMDITMVHGAKNVIFGGEGLFNTVVTGPGKVWIQTMPINKLLNLLGSAFRT